MRYFLTFLVAVVLAAASEETDAVAAVEKTFRAMKLRDETMLRSTMLPDARLYAMRQGEPVGRSTDEFVQQIVASKVELIERFVGTPQVVVRGAMAQVWGEYEFLRDGKFSHCGLDTAVLFKTATGWKIASLSYTVEPTGCRGSK